MSGEARLAALTWHRASGPAVTFQLTGERMLVGRDEEAAVRLDEPLVSRAHAEIIRSEEGFVVRDLGSTNRTRVNDRIVSECQLADGDGLRFARARCTFHLLHSAPSSAAAPAGRDPS